MSAMTTKRALELLEKATIEIDKNHVIYQAENDIHADELKKAAKHAFEQNYEGYSRRVVIKNPSA